MACMASLAMASCSHKGGVEPPEPPNPLNAITTISIDPLIFMPPSVHYRSTGQKWGAAVGGAVGEAIVQSATPGASIRAKLDAAHIDMSAALVEEMRRAMASQRRFRIVDGDADASLKFKIVDYGFESGGLTTSNMTVILKVEAKLLDKKGRTLFEDSENSESERDTRYSMSEYFADTQRLLAAFHQVAAFVAQEESKSLLDEATGG